MTYKGHVENGSVVLDEPVQLEEGTVVEVIITPGKRQGRGRQEPAGVKSAPIDLGRPNGDRLADIVEQWETGLRVSLAGKFGDPVAWQREQRQERLQPGRGGA